ncbi:unnamed protein product [Citrullus colocynthis]|uniref:Uncharacterized protein n=1 Tax=Citrullus colocynthis TaxID=252529 RepID=A0ABP0Y714_9ROSI
MIIHNSRIFFRSRCSRVPIFLRMRGPIFSPLIRNFLPSCSLGSVQPFFAFLYFSQLDRKNLAATFGFCLFLISKSSAGLR